MAPFLPPAWHDAVVDALRDGRGVLGESSATLRGLGVGDRFVFGRDRITVGAIVPDEVVAWSELMVSGEVGRSLGVRHPRFALMDMRTAPPSASSPGGSLPRSGPATLHGCAGRATRGSPARGLRVAARADEARVRRIPA